MNHLNQISSFLYFLCLLDVSVLANQNYYKFKKNITRPIECPDNNNASSKLPKLIASQYMEYGNGEYRHRTVFGDGTSRSESLIFEERNGSFKPIIRGFFSHQTNEGGRLIRAYVLDHLGYHYIPLPPHLENIQIAETIKPPSHHHHRPPQDDGCRVDSGIYCIDQKLLALMVG